jgi:hypothetical protein
LRQRFRRTDSACADWSAPLAARCHGDRILLPMSRNRLLLVIASLAFLVAIGILAS